MHNGAGIAPEFESDLLLACAALEVPADGSASGKSNELDALVSNQQSGVVIGKGQDVETAIGPTGLLNALCQKQRGKRSLRGGFQYHGAACGDCRGRFVSHQLQGKIKWSDARDGTERVTLYDAPASCGELLPIEREVFSINAGGLFGGDVEGKDGAVDFDARQLDRLPGFLDNGSGKFIAPLGNRRPHPSQHTLALESRQTAGCAEGLNRSRDCGLSMFAPGLDHSPHYRAIEGRTDVNELAVFHPASINQETVGCGWRDCKFRHLSLRNRANDF